ncbi:MAG: hypothetical protein ABR559_07220 [Gemmatimonadota bacterium]
MSRRTPPEILRLLPFQDPTGWISERLLSPPASISHMYLSAPLQVNQRVSA